MPTRKHEPIRTCIGCMRTDAQRAMARVAITAAGVATVDLTRSIRGRGAYLHLDGECVARFESSKVKEFKSLKTKIDRETRLAIGRAIRDQLDRGKQVE